MEKEYASTAYFPLYDYSEMEALRKAEFGKALRQRRSSCGFRHGGYPRALSFLPTRGRLERPWSGPCLRGALRTCSGSWERLERPLGLLPVTPRTPCSRCVRDTLTEGEVTFRSDAVAKRAVRQVASLSRDALIPALQRLLASSSTRSVAGTVFEQAAIGVLGRGVGAVTTQCSPS